MSIEDKKKNLKGAIENLISWQLFAENEANKYRLAILALQATCQEHEYIETDGNHKKHFECAICHHKTTA